MTIRSIINKGRTAAETHREHKTDRIVEFQARITASQIRGTTKNIVKFNICDTPPNLSDEEYRDRVSAETLARLKESGVLERMIVTYDGAASSERTERFVDGCQHLVFNAIREPLPDFDSPEFHSPEWF